MTPLEFHLQPLGKVMERGRTDCIAIRNGQEDCNRGYRGPIVPVRWYGYFHNIGANNKDKFEELKHTISPDLVITQFRVSVTASVGL
jgi:hypothetical protein